MGWKQLLRGVIGRALNATVDAALQSKTPKSSAPNHPNEVKPKPHVAKPKPPTQPKPKGHSPKSEHGPKHNFPQGHTAHTHPGHPHDHSTSFYMGKGTVERPEGNRTYVLAHDRPLPHFTYDPEPDNDADPGEVVWTWVPYHEDENVGKDRPVLVVGRYNKHLLAVQLTSKDHDRDRQKENREGRYWIDVGEGAWDKNRRDSEARVDRVLLIRPQDVRRIGAKLDEDIFNAVTAEIAKHW